MAICLVMHRKLYYIFQTLFELTAYVCSNTKKKISKRGKNNTEGVMNMCKFAEFLIWNFCFSLTFSLSFFFKSSIWVNGCNGTVMTCDDRFRNQIENHGKNVHIFED